MNAKDVPAGYNLCVNENCPLASHCLRQMAMRVVSKRERLLTIVNPLRTKPSENCEFFRSDEPLAYARGFLGMQKQMLPGQYERFSSQLRNRFGRNEFYKRRRGERLCSPKNIAFIRKVLADMHLSHLDFDEFETHYNWTD